MKTLFLLFVALTAILYKKQLDDHKVQPITDPVQRNNARNDIYLTLLTTTRTVKTATKKKKK